MFPVWLVLFIVEKDISLGYVYQDATTVIVAWQYSVNSEQPCIDASTLYYRGV